MISKFPIAIGRSMCRYGETNIEFTRLIDKASLPTDSILSFCKNFFADGDIDTSTTEKFFESIDDFNEFTGNQFDVSSFTDIPFIKHNTDKSFESPLFFVRFKNKKGNKKVIDYVAAFIPLKPDSSLITSY